MVTFMPFPWEAVYIAYEYDLVLCKVLVEKSDQSVTYSYSVR